jgi:hypothetical protein
VIFDFLVQLLRHLWLFGMGMLLFLVVLLGLYAVGTLVKALLGKRD